MFAPRLNWITQKDSDGNYCHIPTGNCTYHIRQDFVNDIYYIVNTKTKEIVSSSKNLNKAKLIIKHNQIYK